MKNLVFTMVTLLLAAGAIAAEEHPNVVVILSDDQGWGDLSLNGNQNLSTPNIDGLARAGARFDRFYVCPVCSPTRAEFLIGRYHPRSGVYSTSAGGERMNLDEVTIADVFKAAGYRTGAFGKWHNGMQFPYHPNGRGFDEYYGFCSGHWGDYFSPPLDHNGKLVQGQGFCIDDFTNHAITFMEEAIEQDKPFFAYLPYNTPHSPMQVPDKHWEKFKDHPLLMRNRNPAQEDVQHTRAALAMCENIDFNVGRVLAKLDQWEIAENTIVLYFCDNGPNGTRWNGGMKGRKGSTDEGGVRSPLIIRWPGHIPANTVVTPIAAAIDLLPTLASLADIKATGTKPLDGKSLAPLLTEQNVVWPDREIVSYWRGKTSVRNQRFRLDHVGGLYDIQADPRQDQNVAEVHPEVVERLQFLADQFNATVAHNHTIDNRPFLVGDEEYLYTQVPARDAQGTGGIKRSNKFPNCSYLSNWTQLDERIEWDAVVAASGTYRVELEYACPAEDIGSIVELRFGEASLKAKISEAADPPLRGMENDRHQRNESYVKDFKRVVLGEITLTKGQKQLSLRALEIPGSQVMEFRLLMFTRQ